MRPESRTPLASALSTILLTALIALGVMSAIPGYDPHPYWGVFLLIAYLVTMGYGALVQAVFEAKYG